MKILVYGFEPFGQSATNISQEIVKKLHGRQNLTKVILPVRFNELEILDYVRQAKPDYILGLGQYPRGKKIRIERLAKNEWASKSQPKRAIDDKGPSFAETTLELKANNISFVSHDAGRYFCNHSMYVILTNFETRSIPFAFLHIPKDFDLDLAVRFVTAKINKIFECG